AWQILRVYATSNNHLVFTGPKVQHCYLCVFDPARSGRDCEEDGLTAGQEAGKHVIVLTLGVVRRRQNRRLASSRWNPNAPSHQVGRCENDGTILAPGGAAWSQTATDCDRERWTSGDRNALEVSAVGEANPLPVRRQEHVIYHEAQARDWRRVELIQ